MTEAITGLDQIAHQIAHQIAFAEGRPLTLNQDDLIPQGHAIECRLNAKDVFADFQPNPGRVTLAWFAALPGLWGETHMTSGAMVPPSHDALVAKLIAYGTTKAAAIATMQQALAVGTLHGITTNAALHRAIMADPMFQAGGVDTSYLSDLRPTRTKATP